MVRSRRRTAVDVIMLTSAMTAQTSRSGAGSRGGDVLPFQATETTLPNGLKAIVVPTGFPNLVSLRIAVQAGSRNEVEPGKSGFAHVFEHLIFRGTPQTPAARFREITTRAEVQRERFYRTHTYRHTTMGFIADIENMPTSSRTRGCSSGDGIGPSSQRS